MNNTISTSVTLVLPCGSCRHITTTIVSRFSVRHGVWPMACEQCGSALGRIGSTRDAVWVEVPQCISCNGRHVVQIPARSIWAVHQVGLMCDGGELQVDIGGISSTAAIVQHLQALAEDGSITCPCGGREFTVDIDSDDVTIGCPCGRMRAVAVATKPETIQSIRLRKTGGVRSGPRAAVGLDRGADTPQ